MASDPGLRKMCGRAGSLLGEEVGCAATAEARCGHGLEHPADVVAKVASVEESVAKVEGKVDEMDKKLLAELAELKCCWLAASRFDRFERAAGCVWMVSEGPERQALVAFRGSLYTQRFQPLLRATDSCAAAGRARHERRFKCCAMLGKLEEPVVQSPCHTK
eukprot:COSAG04_NODE_1505_length_6506_cov_4.798335_3_plen_162_part_00